MKNTRVIFMAFVMLLLGTVAGAQENNGVRSSTALPLLVDIEKTPGWMLYLEGGYQWNFFRGVGVNIRDNTGRTRYHASNNFTKSGGAAAIAVGYNFCPKIPLTLGLKIGIGPSNLMETTSSDNRAYHWERVRLYSLDFSFDYEFKNRSRYTPFVGVSGGVAQISQKARAWYDSNNDGNFDYYGKYDTRRKINFMGGVRTGVKYDLNSRVALTLFGQYSYLGKVKGKNFEMTGGGDSLSAQTLKAKVHSVETKLGVRIAF